MRAAGGGGAPASGGGAPSHAQAAREVADFLVGLFRVSEQGLADTVTARELLDKGAERITDELRDQPLVQARLIHTIGRAYVWLGLRESAQEEP